MGQFGDRPISTPIFEHFQKKIFYPIYQITIFSKEEKCTEKALFNFDLFENESIGPSKFSRETGVARPGYLEVRDNRQT